MNNQEYKQYHEKDSKSSSLEHVELLHTLMRIKKTEERVRIIAHLLDKKGIDFIVGLLPALGDIGVGILATTYLLVEGKIAQLSNKDLMKIIAKQAIDTSLGSIPVAGDIYDIFNKSNIQSLKYFEKKTNEIIQLAKIQNIPDENIQQAISNAKKGYEKLLWIIEEKSVRRYILKKTKRLLKKS